MTEYRIFLSLFLIAFGLILGVWHFCRRRNLSRFLRRRLHASLFDLPILTVLGAIIVSSLAYSLFPTAYKFWLPFHALDIEEVNNAGIAIMQISLGWLVAVQVITDTRLSKACLRRNLLFSTVVAILLKGKILTVIAIAGAAVGLFTFISSMGTLLTAVAGVVVCRRYIRHRIS